MRFVRKVTLQPWNYIEILLVQKPLPADLGDLLSSSAGSNLQLESVDAGVPAGLIL